jgi:predicted nucleic acid-binding protein
VIVVADTSIFLNLTCVGQERLLLRLYKHVFAPPEVRDEFRRACIRYPRFAGLTFPEWTRVQPAQSFSSLPEGIALDPGERAALALARDIQADLVLIDESLGRAVARNLGLRVSGILGVLLEAKNAGELFAVRPILDQLKIKAGFWLDESTFSAVLTLAGEQNQ